MLLKALFAFVALLSLVNTSGVAINSQILAQVQMEDQLARFFVDFSLKLRNAISSMQAAQGFSQVLMLEYTERQGVNKLEEDDDEDDRDFNLEENSIGYTLYGEETESDRKQTALTMQASLNFYTALKLKFYQSVIKSREVQANFWMDRYIQETIMVSGAGQNPQIYQFMYFKLFRTNLETIKLALTFQYFSDFTSYLEDEFDVGGPIVKQHFDALEFAKEQADDIISERIAAFSKYSSVATLELFTFYLDMYFGFAQQHAANPASSSPSSPSSFLEVEMKTQPAEPTQPSESKFFPMMASQNPMMFMIYFKLYYLMVQYAGARAGVTSAYAEKLAWESRLNNKLEEAKNYKTFAQNMFGGEFARNLYTGSMIKYIMTFYEFYATMMMSYYSQAQAQAQPQAQAQAQPQAQTQAQPQAGV